MFSCGNVAEKLRVASLACAGEVVVDLYAGIGYFTLPFLVHAGAAFVHACEWNPHAALALRRNLQLNGVAHRCRVHLGDNRELPLRDAADRVNLGLLPSSEAGWPVACRVLRKDAGGILHIHQNVESFSGKSPQKGVPEDEPGAPPGDPLPAAARPEWRSWAASAGARIAALLQQVHGKQWSTRVLRVHPVKSYAPHVDHLVLDLECRPLL
ncbi:tRNA methyltransferase 12 [Cricetulus griseus]